MAFGYVPLIMKAQVARIALVSAFTPPCTGIAILGDVFRRGMQHDGVTVVTIDKNAAARLAMGERHEKYPPAFALLQPLAMFAQLMKHRKNYSEIIVNTCSYWGFATGIVSMLVGLVLRRRVVMIYVGGGGEGFFSRCPWAVSLIRFCTPLIIVHTRFLKKVFQSHGLETVIIPHPLDVHDLETAEPKPPSRNGANREPLRILWVRYFEEFCDPYLILHALSKVAKKNQNFVLSMVGGGSMLSDIKSFAKTLPFTVKFHGVLDRKDVMAQYANADLFVNTTRVDNAPLTVTEATAFGLPVVSTNAGGIPILVDGWGSVKLVKVGDADMLAQAILQLLDSSNLRQELSKKAIEVGKRYSWESTSTKFYQLLGHKGNGLRR